LSAGLDYHYSHVEDKHMLAELFGKMQILVKHLERTLSSAAINL
jgi:hypothetical protein